MEEIIEDVKKKARDSWPGEEGERRAIVAKHTRGDTVEVPAELVGGGS